jgi:hypothetical protein
LNTFIFRMAISTSWQVGGRSSFFFDSIRRISAANSSVTSLLCPCGVIGFSTSCLFNRSGIVLPRSGGRPVVSS